MMLQIYFFLQFLNLEQQGMYVLSDKSVCCLTSNNKGIKNICVSYNMLENLGSVD